MTQLPHWRLLSVPLPRHSLPGKLIVFDGIDGSGKSTHLELLRRKLCTRIECVTTSSPTKDLRKHRAWSRWHRQPQFRPQIDEFGLTLMALGDRLVNQAGVIVPALRRGAVVLSDRYVLSVLAYWATPVHREVIRHLLAPDLGIHCCVDPELAAARVALDRNEPPELHDVQLLRRHARRYEKLAPAYNYFPIDTSTDVLTAANEIASVAFTLIFKDARAETPA